MKLAIVHDDLMRRGGAEQVALSFCKAFPKATLYTLCYHPDLTYPEFKNYSVKTSWFGKFALTERQMKKRFFPLGIWAMKSLDLSEFDVVLVSSTFCGKYIKTKKHAKVILYCHTPFRLAWFPDTYSEHRNTKGLKKILFNSVVSILRFIDLKYAKKADYFLANSNEVLNRMRKCYRLDKPIHVVSPPVKVDNFFISTTPKNYYLLVSRFQPYKKVDLVIETFNEMPDKNLIIVGSGDDEAKLKASAKSNITFNSGLSAQELAGLYANCKAFIFPQHEDFGITALEANASGRPVLAYGSGGILETMIPYTGEGEPFTAIFFESQTTDALKAAITKFESIEHMVDSEFIRINAEKFSEVSFINKIKECVVNYKQ